jgi:hypothetical protein
MKNVFLLLLLVNALLASWTVWREKAGHAPQPVASTPLVKGVASLELVKELSDAKRAELGKVVPREAGQLASELNVGGQDGKPLCKMIGPFLELLQAEYTVEHLSALDVAAEVKNVDVADDSDYWVYFKPLSSRKEAMNLLRELQVKGIDSYVFKRGELRNGISFGLYSLHAAALRRQVEVKALGYESDIFEQQRYRKETWVLVRKDEADKLGQSTWLKFMSERKNQKIKENFCPGVASS